METLDDRLKSKWWRLTHLYKIKTKEGQLKTFKPNPVQLMILATMPQWLRGKILKYRQGGVTTLFCILYLDDALWTPGFSAAIIAHEREALDKIFQIIERAYKNLPDELKPTTRQDTLRMLRFQEDYTGRPLDSSIYVSLKLRGGTVQALHVSERAYIVGAASQELEAGSKQAVPLTGRISEETTGNGFNEFYDAFMEDYNNQEIGPMDGRSYFYAWHEQPEYTLPGTITEYTKADNDLKERIAAAYAGKEITDGQLLWYRWKEKELIKAARSQGDSLGMTGPQLMRQEYPTTILEAFQSGAGQVFDVDLIEAIMPRPILRHWNGVDIWVEPVKAGDKYLDENGVEQEHKLGRKYVVGCDPSDGGVDYGVIDVWDSESCEQVAQFAGKLRPDELADKIKEMAEYYNKAFVGVENNLLATVLFLSKIYSNLYSTTQVDTRTNKPTQKLGYSTNTKTRDLMIDEFLVAFEDGSAKINSLRTIGEMRTFVRKDSGKREHADGKHDDCLFAAFIAIQMRKYGTTSMAGYYRSVAASSDEKANAAV